MGALALLSLGSAAWAAEPKPVSSAGASAVLAPVQISADSVTPGYAAGQVSRRASVGLLGERSVQNTPFSITSYTAKSVEDRQADSLVEVIGQDAAVTSTSSSTNINSDFSIRGFPVSGSDVAFNGMYGLLPWFRVPVVIAERIELQKGPGALLYGMSPNGAIGGVVNLVPKRAGDDPLTRITLGWQSDSLFGLHVDAGRRFGPEQRFGVRFNGVYENGDTAIDRQSLESHLESVALDYRGERVRASLDLLYRKYRLNNETRQFSLAPAVTDIPSAPDSTVNYPGYGFSDLTTKMAVGRIEYDLSRAVTVYGGVGHRFNRMNALAGNASLLDNAGNYISTPAWQVQDADTWSLDFGIKGNFSLGGVFHRWVLDANRLDADRELSFVILPPARLSNLHDPVYTDTPSVSGIDADLKPYVSNTLTSVALADTLYFLDDRVQLTLGARHQRVESQGYNFTTGQRSGPGYDEAVVTPGVGLVVKPWQHVSLYANYIEGLSPGPTAPTGTVNAGEMFEPLETRQVEGGVKVHWRDWGASLALYQLTKPSSFVDGNNVFDVNGEQRHRGIEVNVQGDLLANLHLLASASHLQSRLRDTKAGQFDGNQGIGVPEWQLKASLGWDTPFVPGLTLKAGALYSSKLYVNQANTLSVPSTTRYNAGAAYRTRVADKNLTLRATVNNLFGDDAWGVANAGYLFLQDPRTVRVSVSVDL